MGIAPFVYMPLGHPLVALQICILCMLDCTCAYYAQMSGLNRHHTELLWAWSEVAMRWVRTLHLIQVIVHPIVVFLVFLETY